MFIDAFKIKNNNSVIVIEKNPETGKRTFRKFSGKRIYYFYVENENGRYRTLDGKIAKKLTFDSKYKMNEELKKLKFENKKVYESDIDEINKVLLDNYKDTGIPELNIAFFDIEVEMDKKRGFAMPSDPFGKVIMISVFRKWLDEIITISLLPPNMTKDEVEKKTKHIENIIFVDSEEKLFEIFFYLIEEADVITGWNTGGYDIPYMINRIKKMKEEGEFDNVDISDFCFIPKELEHFKYQLEPKKREFEKFGTNHETYDLYGRIHIDYLHLYRKHLGKEMDSLSLDNVAEAELGERKVEYEGNLYDLYLNDIVKFIEYSKHDVRLVKMLDDKKRYIDLCNLIAHENCVPISKTLGSIAVIEQALIKLAHESGFIIPESNKTIDENDHKDESEGTAGAFVVKQKKGLHDYVCLVDINSLYPSTIRSLNLSPETIYGQLLPTYTSAYIKKKIKESKKKITYSDVMKNLFTSLEYLEVMNKTNKILNLYEEETKQIREIEAKKIYEMIKNKDICITANGTLIKTNKKGLIPLLLEKWYDDRKKYKELSKIFDKLSSDGIDIKKQPSDNQKEEIQ